ncbi:MAG: hypothetical protein K2F77_09655 [Muribaculaceae bacterium]|nr:hypothetical protein [Muribaculaceae bacterium]
MLGGIIGFVIAAVAIVLFGDTSFSEFADKFRAIDVPEILAAVAVAVAAFVVSVSLLVVIHEAGHMVCGLASGYRFVSFRIFSFTFVRDAAGRLRVKRFSLAGTGGQCLLCPPERPLEEIPVVWYNAGGLLANLLAFLVVLPLMWLDLNPFVKEFAGIFLITDAGLLLLNGIPMQSAGMGNDAHNMIALRRNLAAKRGVMLQLKVNSMVQEGARPKDLPAEWFAVSDCVDYRNALEVSVPLMAASRLLDMERWEEAYGAFSAIYAHREELMPLYAKETACELACCAMLTGRTVEAEELLADKELRKYVEAYRRVMSSKERLLCAEALFIRHDRDAAEAICEELQRRSPHYLLQGEVRSDLALMRAFLK